MQQASREEIRSMSAAGLRAFFNIMKVWGVGDAQAQLLLGSPARSTFYKWKSDPEVALSHDTLERISYILGIYKALQILFPASPAADGWVKKANDAPLFNGQSALERMSSGHMADLYVVRQYLDAMRGGWA